MGKIIERTRERQKAVFDHRTAQNQWDSLERMLGPLQPVSPVSPMARPVELRVPAREKPRESGWNRFWRWMGA